MFVNKTRVIWRRDAMWRSPTKQTFRPIYVARANWFYEDIPFQLALVAGKNSGQILNID